MAKRAQFLTAVLVASVISLVVVATASGQHQSSSGSGSEVGATLLQTPTPTPTATPEPTPVPEVVEVVRALSEEAEVLTATQTFILVLVAVAGSVYLLGTGFLFALYGVLRTQPGGGSTTVPSAAYDALTHALLQGVALVLVVVAVFILGLQGKISDEGLVGIFAAIVGYVLGRSMPRGNGGSS